MTLGNATEQEGHRVPVPCKVMRASSPLLWAGGLCLCAASVVSAPRVASAQEATETTARTDETRAASAMSLEAARVYFTTVEDASAALVVLESSPRDQNGEVRAWDARFRARLAEVSALDAEVCATSLSSCSARGVHALLCEVTSAVRGYRTRIYRHPRYRGASPVEDLERRDAVADEAARREALALSCEDLPSPEALRTRATEDAPWTTIDDRPLRSEAASDVPDAIGRVEIDADDPYMAEAESPLVPRALPILATQARPTFEVIADDPYVRAPPRAPVQTLATQTSIGLRTFAVDSDDPYL